MGALTVIQFESPGDEGARVQSEQHEDRGEEERYRGHGDDDLLQGRQPVIVSAGRADRRREHGPNLDKSRG